MELLDRELSRVLLIPLLFFHRPSEGKEDFFFTPIISCLAAPERSCVVFCWGSCASERY
jgi:hypothetical protein